MTRRSGKSIQIPSDDRGAPTAVFFINNATSFSGNCLKAVLVLVSIKVSKHFR